MTVFSFCSGTPAGTGNHAYKMPVDDDNYGRMAQLCKRPGAARLIGAPVGRHSADGLISRRSSLIRCFGPIVQLAKSRWAGLSR